jgi:hypothetical protein
VNVPFAASIQKTHPAGTRPVLPSDVGSGIAASNDGAPCIASFEKVIASGGD